jgi:hypothetical protein
MYEEHVEWFDLNDTFQFMKSVQTLADTAREVLGGVVLL